MAGYAKVSVTLPTPLLDRIKGRVGSRGLSSYVAQALEAQERREALRAWLEEQDAIYGPVPDEVLEEVRQRWLAGAGPAS